MRQRTLIAKYCLAVIVISLTVYSKGTSQLANPPAPTSPNSILGGIKELIAEGKLREAQRALLDLNSSNSEALKLSALVHYQLHEYAKAASDEEAALRDKKGTPEWLQGAMLVGRSYYLSNQPMKAINWLEQARLAGDRNEESAYMLGNAYLQTRDFTNATACLAALFGASRDSAAAHLITAHLMMARGMGTDAKLEAVRALDLDPAIAGAHFLLGEVAISAGNTADAIAELSKEVSSNPTFPMAYYGLGQAYALGGDWSKAIPVLEEAIFLDPNFGDPYTLLGKSYFNQGDFANAEGVLRRAISMNQSNQSAYYLLGQVLIKEGRSDEGKKMLQRSRELNGGNGEH